VEVKEIYSLWQLDGEIRKLLAFCHERQVEEEDVANLVAANEETDVLDIIDAIGEGSRVKALSLLTKLLAEE
jgi:DNA polymerase III delta subunit